MKKTVAIYARVSTDDQSTDMQVVELRQYAEARGWATKEYTDQGQSGAKQSRPALDALLTDVRRRRIDVVLVWTACRLARNLQHLLAMTEEFSSLGVDLVVLKQNIDTSSAAGRLTYSVLGAVAEFEREMLRERVRAGMMQARRKGKQIGRPPLRKLSNADIAAIRAAREQGASTRRLASQFATSQWTICRLLRPE
jgi:DNA invertase Pin-like site-specific DNA recombinase